MPNQPNAIVCPKAKTNKDCQIASPCPSNRLYFFAACAMLFVSALPDAMVVPVLKQLLVDRYGVSVGAAHAFMCVNLVGALAAIALVGFIRRKCNLANTILIAAILNAALLGIMAYPIGFIPTLFLRCAEGAVDLIVYAVIFTFIARTGPSNKRGQRMGAAATAMMLGIASGLAVGGIIGKDTAVMCLIAGAIACLVVACAAPIAISKSTDHKDKTEPENILSRSGLLNLWRPLAMMFSDRFVASLLVITIPLYLGSISNMSPSTIGGLVGIAMLMTAIGTWPAGRLADRFGSKRLRLICGLIYAPAVALIPYANSINLTVTLLDFLLIGIAGAGLFASSLLVIANTQRGPGAMGAYHAAGNLGFLLGPITAGVILSTFSESEIGVSPYLLIFIGFALLHVLVTSATVFIRAAQPAQEHTLATSATPTLA